MRRAVYYFLFLFHNVICQLIVIYVTVIRRNCKHLFNCTLEAPSPGFSLIVVLCVTFVSHLFISLMNGIYVLFCFLEKYNKVVSPCDIGEHNLRNLCGRTSYNSNVILSIQYQY